MSTKMVAMSAALLGVLAVLVVGLFVAFAPGSSSGSGKSDSRQAVSSFSNAPHQQSVPADTAKVTPNDKVPEQRADPANNASSTTAALEPDTGLSLASSRELAIDGNQFHQLLPRDAIAPVYDAKFMPAQSSSLAPDELVIGVAINGVSKAYPVGPLNFREMVNDTVGSVPVLVTW